MPGAENYSSRHDWDDRGTDHRGVSPSQTEYRMSAFIPRPEGFGNRHETAPSPLNHPV